MSLHKTFPVKTRDDGTYTHFCATNEGHAVVHSWISGQKQLDIYDKDGHILESYPSPHNCNDQRYKSQQDDQSGEILAISFNNKKSIAASCELCGIFFLTRETGNTISSCDLSKMRQKFLPGPMCQKSENTFISLATNEHKINIFDCSTQNSIKVTEEISMPDNVDTNKVGFLCYDSDVIPGGLLIVTYNDIHYISATSIDTKKLHWRVKGEIAEKLCQPWGVCTDNKGRIYVADGYNGRVIVLRARDGKVLQILNLGLHGICYIAWSDTQPHLILYCWPRKGDNAHVSFYNVEM